MVAKELRKDKNIQRERLQAGTLNITYYTDPLCCWSWAFEPQWRKLLFEYNGLINYRYCMGGLLPGWTNYHDSVNNVSRPIQMGPVWMHAREVSGMPMQQNIWMQDPPASSYPSCIAVKCAGLQSGRAAEIYLRLLREAIMIKGDNIAQQKVLLKEAEKLPGYLPGFDIQQFNDDLKNEHGIEPFRKDLQEVQYHNINRFPSLVIKSDSNKAIIISGHRPYNILLNAIQQVSDLPGPTKKIDPEEYKAFWPFVTDREIKEI
jgi:putative protein-disulfide isomerase